MAVLSSRDRVTRMRFSIRSSATVKNIKPPTISVTPMNVVETIREQAAFAPPVELKFTWQAEIRLGSREMTQSPTPSAVKLRKMVALFIAPQFYNWVVPNPGH